jgi:phosphoserine phosphatase
MSSVVAGTKYRGQFEERMRSIINELRTNPNVIVFIDEIHTLVGAGNQAGQMDAANMMKPALARGELQCIGATTLDEYRNSIEKDGALERRFQKVMVEPTTSEETLQILENIKDRYEAHHHVEYTHEALVSCVKLTGRYVGEIVDGHRKAELLKLIAQVEKVNLAQTIAVGDGANDLPMIAEAGLGIAFHAKPRVVANAEQSINTIGLDGVLYFLGFKDSYLGEQGKL